MSGYINLPVSGTPSWRSPVATSASLPVSGNVLGDAIAAEDTGVIYVWTGSSWTAPSGSGTVTSVAMSVPSFLSVAGSPITGSGTLAVTLSGTALPIANGGTAATTQQAAINSLTGSQTSGYYLRSDGTNAALAAIVANDVPTLNQNTTGTAANITATSNATLTTLSALTTASSLVSIGTISSGTWAGTTIAVGHGGTGLTSATAYAVLCGGTTSGGAFQSVSGVGTSGQVLTSNGASALPTWQAAAGGGVSGPGSSTDTAIARWNGTGGNTLEDSVVLVSGVVSGQVTIQLPNTNSSSNNNILAITGSNNTGSGNAGDLYLMSGVASVGFDGGVYLGDSSYVASPTKLVKFGYGGSGGSRIFAAPSGALPQYTFQGDTTTGMGGGAGYISMWASNKEAFYINTDGSMQLVYATSCGLGSISASGTDGFFYLNSYGTSGPPSGTPAAHGGLALWYDTGANKLYIYNTASSSWKGVTFS